MTYSPSNSEAPFLPTSIYFPNDFDEMRVKLLEINRNIANNMNIRKIGVFETVEFIAGESWFNESNSQNKRGSFRKVFSIGTIAAGATYTQAHGITGFSTLKFVDIYGTAIVDAVNFNQRPIPYIDVALLTNGIQIDTDNTNLRIINGATAADILSAIVVLEYLKN